MKSKTKKILGGIGALLTLTILTACNSFCDDTDFNSYRYGYDPINVKLFDSREDALAYAQVYVPEVTFETKITDKNGQLTPLISEETFGDYNLYYIHSYEYKVSEEKTVYFSKNTFVQEVETSAKTAGVNTPYYAFYEELDKLTLKTMGISKNATYKELYGYEFDDYLEYLKGDSAKLSQLKLDRENSALLRKGYLKYQTSNENVISNILEWNQKIIKENSYEFGMNTDFSNLYKNLMATKVSANLKTCITVEDGFYGHINNDPLEDTVLVTSKAPNGFLDGWGQAFAKHGFIEGLLVYPISYGVENMAHAFGMNGAGQILAVLLMTVICRLALALITLPSTIQTQKTQLIQPEIAKLQQKYPNANTNQYEKQRMAQAQMELYKKHKVHPLLPLVALVFQFPVFIGVWNAFTGSASLSRDSFLGLYLSTTIWDTLKNISGWPGNPAWWTALVLILLMSGSQILAMLLPQWLNKKRQKTVVKTVVSNSQNDTAKQQKMTSWIMTAMIIFMGFTLPSAMGVYWFAGALFSAAQTLITQIVLSKKGF